MDRRSPQLDLTLVWVDREATIRLRGELDLSSLPHALKGLEEILQREPDKLILDLAGLSFADSYGLALIVRAYKGLHGRPVIICSPSRQVRRVLQITGIDQVCAIEDPGLQWAAPPPGFLRSPKAARPRLGHQRAGSSAALATRLTLIHEEGRIGRCPRVLMDERG